jgi:hypothetical protein
VIINTHAPGVVQLCNPQDLLLAESAPYRTSEGAEARGLLLLPFRDSWRAASGDPTFSEADIVAYLASPPEAQLRLPWEMVG